MEHLFAYGTLMSAEVMDSVIGERPQKKRGVLKGYKRNAVKNENYPAITPAAESEVDGIVYYNISEPSWVRLDSFEGEMYTRSLVEVTFADGSTKMVHTYVVKSDYLGMLSSKEWDFAEFLQRGKDGFIKHYHGYDTLK